MVAKFITLNSRITINKGVFREKKIYVDNGDGFDRFISFLALCAGLGFCIYQLIMNKDYYYIVQILLIGFWLESHFKRIYRALFVKTWMTYFKLSDIKGFSTQQLENGLETEVALKLKNGRKKFLIFRDGENQLDSFINAIKKEDELTV